MTTRQPGIDGLDATQLRRMAACWRAHAPSEMEGRLCRQRVAASKRKERGGSACGIVALASVVAAAASIVAFEHPRVPVSGESAVGASVPPVSDRAREPETPPPTPSAVPAAARGERSPAAKAELSDIERADTPGRRRVARVAKRSKVARRSDAVVPAAVQPARAAPLAGGACTVTAHPKQNAPVLRLEEDESERQKFAPNALARDAAALSRAYLWVSDGCRARALPLLERLTRGGATPSIRHRAGQLLLRASERPASSRRTLGAAYEIS